MCPTAPGDFSYWLNSKTTKNLNRKWRGCMAASAGGARQDILGPPGILQTFVFILFDDSYRLFILFLNFLTTITDFIYVKLIGLGRPR